MTYQQQSSLDTFIALCAAFAIVIAGCSSDQPSRDFEGSDIDISGPLSDYLSVVEGTYTIEASDASVYGDWKLPLQLERTDRSAEGVEFMELELKIELVDESGRPVSSVPPLYVDSKQDLLALLESQTGTREWIEFSANGFGASDDVKGVVPGDVHSFTLSSSADVLEEVKGEKRRYYGELDFGGDFTMDLTVNREGRVSGRYQKGGKHLALYGTMSDGVLALDEYEDGKKSGTFAGDYESHDDIEGYWESTVGTMGFPFRMSTVKSTDTDPVDSGTEDIAESSDCVDVLQEFEEFTDRYIRILKKSADGDLSAVGDLQDLKQHGDRLTSKIESAQGRWNANCLQRYQRLLAKYQNAMTEM